MADKPTLLVAFPLDDDQKNIVTTTLAGAVNLICLNEVPKEQRATTLRRSDAILAWNLKGFTAEERTLLAHAKLLQFMTAGVDFIPFGDIPASLPVAANGGAYAEAIAEHALAMALAAAKQIVRSHAEVARGEFHQHRPNRMLTGGICGILGFGGIGLATAKLMRAVGMHVHAINRSPRPHEALDWCGTPDQLDTLLAATDVLVISVPLTKATEGMIGARELNLMKRDAILINLARGEIVDEAALYAHLRTNPGFTACIDAWWVEPVRHGTFRMDHPFTDLPNVVASPHNSSSVLEARVVALRNAVANCRRALLGETPLHLVRAEDKYL